jgi:hypothetical protein
VVHYRPVYSVSQTKIDYTIKVKATDSFGNSFEQVVKLEYIAVSIKDALTKQIKVYPNPIQSSWLNIDLSGTINDISSYKLLTSEGLELVTGMKLSGSSHTLKLPENMNPGMYFLELEINGHLVHKKLVKE